MSFEELTEQSFKPRADYLKRCKTNKQLLHLANEKQTVAYLIFPVFKPPAMTLTDCPSGPGEYAMHWMRSKQTILAINRAFTV